MNSETEASTMKQEETTALLPKLRFPEFRGTEEWKEKPLKAAAEINPANGGLPESFVYIDLESVDAGELKAKDRISRVGAPSRAQRLVERGDIIYQVVRPYQRNNLLCEFDHDENYVASTGYAQLRANGNNRFLYQSIHIDSFVGRVIAKCTGSNYPAINSSDLAEIHLPIPPTLIEQQKIADCLSSLDELIAAQARKAEALKTHKKGLMQQLFPREGETRPCFRFPEFQNAGEWEATTLGEYFCPIRNGFVGTATPYYTSSDGVPYLQGKNVKGGRIDASNLIFITPEFHFRQKKSHLKTGDILMVQSGHVGECAVVGTDYEGCNCHALVILSPSRNLNSEFFVHYFYAPAGELAIFQITTGNTIKHILASELKTLPVLVPKPAEQQRIASCISNLDVLLTAEIQKLESLKTHKKGLMQQLFPSTGGMSYE
ncbi:MAG: restriction endonuclease subunit S [Cyanobium sp. D14.bin.5]|nr:restriction endonuclease subunit S [Cyanobium sp. D14.bin.5]